MAPALLPTKPSARQSPSEQQRTELTCSVNFRDGTVLVADHIAAGAAANSIRASMSTAAPATPVTQPPAADTAAADGNQQLRVTDLLQTAGWSGPSDHAAALACIGSAGGASRQDGVSALPDKALHPTQLDAALHLAAADAPAAMATTLRVPAAADCFSLHSPAASQGITQQPGFVTALKYAASCAAQPQDGMSKSDHRLYNHSACRALAGMVAKPLTADLSGAGMKQTMLSQHAAGMLYGIEWQATAATGMCYATPHRPSDAPAMSANASPVAVRMQASHGPARMAAAGVQLAAVHAAGSPDAALALSTAAELGIRPAQCRSAMTAVQSGVLAGIAKTLARESIATRVSTQALNPQNAMSMASRAAAAPCLRLNVSSVARKQSVDEHGVLLSGGAGFTPAMTPRRQSMAHRAASRDRRLQGTVVITGECAGTSCSLYPPLPAPSSPNLAYIPATVQMHARLTHVRGFGLVM